MTIQEEGQDTSTAQHASVVAHWQKCAWWPSLHYFCAFHASAMESYSEKHVEESLFDAVAYCECDISGHGNGSLPQNLPDCHSQHLLHLTTFAATYFQSKP
jgi:hypothetical protein